MQLTVALFEEGVAVAVLGGDEVQPVPANTLHLEPGPPPVVLAEILNTTLGRKEGNVLFNDALNTFYLRLYYGVRHMVKDHSDSERANPLPPQGLLFPISSKGYFICIIPQTG